MSSTSRHALPRLAFTGALLALAATQLTLPRAGANVPRLAEREPNEDATTGFGFEAPARLEGALGRSDRDVYILLVDDDASTSQVFDLSLEGDGQGAIRAEVVAEGALAPTLTLGATVAAPTADAVAVLLPPARYVVTVRGAAGPYALTIATRDRRPYTLPAAREYARADSVPSVADARTYILPAGDAWLRWVPKPGRYDLSARAMGEVAIELARPAARRGAGRGQRRQQGRGHAGPRDPAR